MREQEYGQFTNQESGFQRVRLKDARNFHGWNSQVYVEFPRDVELTILNLRVL